MSHLSECTALPCMAFLRPLRLRNVRSNSGLQGKHGVGTIMADGLAGFKMDTRPRPGPMGRVGNRAGGCSGAVGRRGSALGEPRGTVGRSLRRPVPAKRTWSLPRRGTGVLSADGPSVLGAGAAAARCWYRATGEYLRRTELQQTGCCCCICCCSWDEYAPLWLLFRPATNRRPSKSLAPPKETALPPAA